MEKIIAQGAEAFLIKKGSAVLKKRIKKSYRIQQLDEKLRRQRTKREIKLLQKAFQIIPVPKVLSHSETEISLEWINGKKLSDNLDKLANQNKICKKIGNNIAKLHDLNIIHGDLTTSNMILANKNNKLYFIDFGLGFESNRAEDKATDLHVLKEAIEARHFKHADKSWKSVLEGYKNSINSKQTLAQLKKVEARGRYKQSY